MATTTKIVVVGGGAAGIGAAGAAKGADKSAEVVGKAGLDSKKWEACARDTASEAHKEAARKVDAQMATGETHGVEGTPAFFINCEMVGGAVPLEELEAVVQSALKRRG